MWRVTGMRSFLRDCAGSMLPFTMVTLGSVVLIGALAVNTVRMDHARSVVQSILDICVLNAAAQRQTLEPRTVFDDCLAKHGFEGTVTSFSATTGRVKTVTATATVGVDTMFLAAPKTYTMTTTSSATEEQTNLEIVLALDVSASMLLDNGTGEVKADGTIKLPLEYMQDAAVEFVTTMLQDDTEGRVTITLLPYSHNVNLGADIASKLNLTNLPATYSVGANLSQMRCADLPATMFASTAISPTTALAALPFVDISSSTRQTNSTSPTATTEMKNGFVWPSTTATGATTTTASDTNSFAVPGLMTAPCSMWRVATSAANSIVRLPDFSAPGQQGSVDSVAERTAQLASQIRALVPTGETSVNLAVRWSLAFLDPAMRPVFASFAGEGRMSQVAKDRPLDFTDPSSIKVIVLLTDGTNFNEFRLKSQYVRGPSPFYIGSDGNLSWFNPLRSTADKYWVPHRDSGKGLWQTTPWTVTGTARQLDYEELWRRVKLTYVAWQFHARSASTTNSVRTTAYNNALTEYRTSVTTVTKDDQQTQACTQARNKKVYVYTIGYRTATTDFASLQACATTPAQFYEATSAGLKQAFSAIALHITRLQLTE